MVKRSVTPIPKIQMPKVETVKVQPVNPPKTNTDKNQGSVGGKSLIPQNLRQFPIEQLQGHSLRELQEISKNRAKPPVDRTIKPSPLTKPPKEGHT